MSLLLTSSNFKTIPLNIALPSSGVSNKEGRPVLVLLITPSYEQNGGIKMTNIQMEQLVYMICVMESQ